jgi:uncharacterized protein YdhG (YjbR/CyaY superfamily)
MLAYERPLNDTFRSRVFAKCHIFRKVKTTRRVFGSVDDYVSSFPPDVAEKLELIRKTIKKAAPKAEESISYNMPTYKQDGPLIYFAVFKSHIGLYPGSIKLPLNKPIEARVISEIVKHQLRRKK